MANRNDSDARDQETLPGPGPGRGLSSGSGIRPVEQMVDAAIERIARERTAHERSAQAQNGDGRLAREPVALARAREQEGGHELDLAPYESRGPIQRAGKPSRLRWKGLDVSEEFRTYAERVARGEDLPPFEGRVLAEPNASFPWDPQAPQHAERDDGHGSRTALWCSAAVVLALLAWSIAVRFETPAPVASDVPAAFDDSGEPPRTALPHDVVESGVAPLHQRAAARALPELGSSTLPAPTEGAAPPSRVEPTGANGPGATAANAVGAPAGAAPAARAAAPNPPGPSAPAKPAPPAAPVPASGVVAHASELAAAVPVAKASREDDFGILPEADPSSAALGVTPAPTPSAAKSAPVAPGNVGDLARVGEPLPAGVRKEPERESSAKGSLLVETPPF